MRRVLTVVDPAGSATPVEVEVAGAPGTPLGDVRDRVLGAVGRRDGQLFCGDSVLSDDAALGEPPLLQGAVLTVDRADHREPRGMLELHVVAGPDSGAVHRLAPGEHGVGRAAEASVRLDDPDVSRLHALLRVAAAGSGGTTVHDLGSTNGTELDGEPVTRRGRPLRPGEVLRGGESRLTLLLPELVPVSCRWERRWR
jgi:S-DNA-T family DNA segregation ATPase FtsK/SpoIIIE